MSSQPLRPPTPSSESERSRTSISDDFENLSGIPLTPFEHTFPPRPHSHSGHHRSGLENGIRNRGGDDGEMEKFDRREVCVKMCRQDPCFDVLGTDQSIIQACDDDWKYPRCSRSFWSGTLHYTFEYYALKSIVISQEGCSISISLKPHITIPDTNECTVKMLKTSSTKWRTFSGVEVVPAGPTKAQIEAPEGLEVF
ncbi:hypothetical protein FRC03_008808 [Tulasnella sp. 419]|nr:hypothetical protein FRC03_008808 [Tulasnella sp. 419]